MNEIQKNNVGAIDVEKIRTYLETMNLTSNLNKQEVQQFIEIASAFGLNPFKREIYASKYGDKFSIIVGYETYIKRAERTERLSGWNVRTEGVHSEEPSKCTLKAVITIFRKDFDHPFIHEVFFNEYVQKTRDGRINKFWHEKPMTMIKKVATAQGFRLCFSDELGGLPYTKEEIDFEEGHAVVVENKPKKTEKKHASPEEIRKKEIAEKIQNAQTNEDLVAIWKNNPDLQPNKKFEQTIKDRREVLINEGKIVVKQKAKKEEEEIVEVHEEPDHSAFEIPVAEITAAIEKCEDEDCLIELIVNEKRREILIFAQEKMKKLQFKN